MTFCVDDMARKHAQACRDREVIIDRVRDLLLLHVDREARYRKWLRSERFWPNVRNHADERTCDELDTHALQHGFQVIRSGATRAVKILKTRGFSASVLWREHLHGDARDEELYIHINPAPVRRRMAGPTGVMPLATPEPANPNVVAGTAAVEPST